MKKVLILITLVVTCFLFTGCGALTEINLKQLEKMMKRKETFILEVMKTDCSHCESFTPKFKQVLKENKIKAYRIDADKMTKKEKSKFDGIIYASGTPTVVFIKKGKTLQNYTRIEGDVPRSVILKKIEDAGFLKK